MSRFGRRGDSRRAAAEQLAELDRLVWAKGGENDWLDLQVYLGRLQVALRTAGVPWRLVKRLRNAAVGHWRAVEHSGDPEVGWIALGSEPDKFAAAKDAVLDWLDRPWHFWRKLRAWRASNEATTTRKVASLGG
ncbi:hypothetical protein [Salinispora pacifica]|uniref:hypothetical protein n=1 Tax=Salinispora pacifica TaxID=351187 RepID=UPI0004811BEF|nr:hypothetical protein [Salinispora pacifica]